MAEFTNMSYEDYLEHYGVKGMKWGTRRGGLRDRMKGAHNDSLQRRITTNKEIAGGRGQTRDYARRTAFNPVGMAMPLVAGNKKLAARRVKTLEARQKRVNSGKTTLRDKGDYLFTTSIADLAISRRDKRGEPGSPKAKQNTGFQTARNIVLGVGGTIAIATIANQASSSAAVALRK